MNSSVYNSWVYEQMVAAQNMAAQRQALRLTPQQIAAQQLQMTEAAWQQEIDRRMRENAPERQTLEQYRAEFVRSTPEEAKQRAKALLLENLTPEQRETFHKNGWFVVEGGRSQQRYRIRALDSLVANVDVLTLKRIDELEKTLYRLCGHLTYDAKTPLYDHLLAQKLMLEDKVSEDEFLRWANRHAA